MTARQLAAEALLRGRRAASRTIGRFRDDPRTSHVSSQELQRSLEGRSFAVVSERIRNNRGAFLTPGLVDLASTAAAIKELFPGAEGESRIEARAILNHQIPIFSNTHDLGPVIDWHCDPCSGQRWPLRHYSQMPLIRGDGADVRVVWELNRLQHFTTLGRAYALTGDDGCTEEFLAQLASWNKANPPRFGPNWMNAMEAAIRAVNIIAALQMFSSSPKLTDEAIELILRMLIAHGSFIRANLEFTHRLASNHFLSDLIGLFAIGMIFPELKQSRDWLSYSTHRLLVEMDRQVLTDGVDYEGAVAYHRFVVEIFALFFLANRSSGVEISGRYWERLGAMFDFVRCYLKPDGTAPRIGDSDDGRLIRFVPRSPDDHSYLMPIAAILMNDETFKHSQSIDEEAIWWFGKPGRAVFDRLAVNERVPASQAFPEAQIFVQRNDQLYSIIDCGDHGAKGRGSHAHSDALSIEVFAHGRTFLRDPGTFVYTGSEIWRNRFRSTAFHNTARIDGEEISQMTDGAPFILGSNVRPLVNLWESNEQCDVLDAEHHAYERLPKPVIHRRVVTFSKREGHWTIDDIFTGLGSHLFEFFFNFDAELTVTLDDLNCATARHGNMAMAVMPTTEHRLEAKIEPRWVSPAYGTRLTSSAIIYSLTAEAPLRVSFLLRVFEADITSATQ